MKTLTPAMRKALIGARETQFTTAKGEPVVYITGHPRTIGALEDRDLVEPFGEAGDYRLTRSGIAAWAHLLTVAREAAEQAAHEIQTQLEDVAYLVGKDGSESDRAMFRTMHADNTGALEMLRAGELDAANLVQGGWVTPAAPHGWDSTATPVVSGFTPIILPTDAMEVCEAAQSAGLVITEPGYVDCRVIYIRKPDTHMGQTVVTVVAYRSGDLSFHDGTDAGLTRDAALTLVRSFTPVPPVATETDHTIPMVPADAREASYGITHKSQYVYRTSKSSYPTRIVRWSNVGRLNPRNGQPVRFGEVGPIDGGDGQYLDPRNRATDNPVTILVSTEDITIDAYGTGTGTVGSGQVYAPNGEILRPGETVTLTYGDDTSGPYPVRFTGNGHGYVEI